MTRENNALVLEIFKLEASLKMSLFEKRQLVSTVRQYSQQAVSFQEIQGLSDEITHILNRANTKGMLDEELVHRLKKLGQLLYDQLLTRPIKEVLRTTHIQDLVVLLDEELIEIPWELIYDGSDFLSLKFNLGRLLKTKEKTNPPRERTDEAFLKMLILVNPTNDLEAAYYEGLYIKNQFDKKKNQITIDFKSTQIDTLYVKKNFRDYDIVHFAGHCEYDQDEIGHSGWVMADGKLTVQDIALLGDSLSMPTLIFSNACQSAHECSGAIDSKYQRKTYNLASAFLFSGVRHYIGTIRQMEDTVSISFAREFYTELVKGKSVGECMRLGRLKLIRDFGMDSIFWASYLLYGDPNFFLFTLGPKLTVASRTSARKISKKIIVRVTAAAVALLLGIALLAVLPSINPTTYFLSLKAEKLLSQGKNEAAINIYTGILKKEPLFLAAYPHLAEAQERLGRREDALNSYFDYVLYSDKKKDIGNLISAYTHTGWLYQELCDYRKAMEFYKKALALSRQHKDKLHEAEAMRKLAVWHMDQGDNNSALELLTKCVEIDRERQQHYAHRYNLACDYFDLGLLFANKDDFETAKDFYTKSQQLFKKMQLRHELSDYYFNLGEMYLFDKEYHKAQDCYKKGMEIDIQHDNKISLTSDYVMLGELYIAMDNLQKAEDCFLKALQLSRDIKARPEEAEANFSLGLLYKRKNQKNRAREYLRQAQEFYRNIDASEYENIKKELLALDT